MTGLGLYTKKLTRTALLICIFLSGLAPYAMGQRDEPAPVITLAEAFDLALRHSEQLAISSEAVVELEARIREFASRAGPQLSLNASELLQDVPNGEQGLLSVVNRRSLPEARVSLRQPLFSGWREFLAIKAARAQSEAAASGLERAKNLLYLDVALAYYGLLAVQLEIRTRLAVIGTAKERVEELKAREAVGRSRESEVLAAEVQLARIEGRIARARAEERAARETLLFIMGTQPLKENFNLVEPPLPSRLEPLERFLRRAAKRADVEAERHKLRSSEFDLNIARRSGWPTIGLDSNYYLKRAGFQEDIRWDALFSVELPLYSGGAVRSRRSQAESRLRAAQQALALAARRAELEILSAYRDWESGLETAAVLEKAARLAEANARVQSRDYRLDRVSNLEVLDSLNALQEARLDWERARVEALLAQARLEAAAERPGGWE